MSKDGHVGIVKNTKNPINKGTTDLKPQVSYSVNNSPIKGAANILNNSGSKIDPKNGYIFNSNENLSINDTFGQDQM